MVEAQPDGSFIVFIKERAVDGAANEALIRVLADHFGRKKAEIEMLPLQPGDVPDTYADVTDLVEQFHYKPSTLVDQGVANFVDWYRQYFSN